MKNSIKVVKDLGYTDLAGLSSQSSRADPTTRKRETFEPTIPTDLHYSNKLLVCRELLASWHNCRQSRRQLPKVDSWLHANSI